MPNTTTATPVAVPMIQHPLADLVTVDLLDVSDCCPSKPALAVLLLTSTEHALLFCGHHARDYWPRLSKAFAYRLLTEESA